MPQKKVDPKRALREELCKIARKLAERSRKYAPKFRTTWPDKVRDRFFDEHEPPRKK